ncbi:type B 50S ribosomal protein L31 [Nocardioides panacisoli]|uniref:type B 50S ribosomal protein L31 n=1 Tax=Nocardioides panacisoli TaxID=627624 RepID=UPI001C6334D7|nr:type B 50S ribosomal protein L31 [Nocardioides panacisoli]QYJ03675.1 type B 50S ribosomal protein L31 [Nocardioides panacisoli]
MRQGIHPDYGHVAFRDRSTGHVLVTRSTLAGRVDPDHTVEFDGVTHPVVDVDVSRHSHPFWTGRGRVVDTEGRVEKFERRYGRREVP